MAGGDFNDHTGEEISKDEEVMGKYSVKDRNMEGQTVVDSVSSRMKMKKGDLVE